ncbi:hypothetical protein CC1G_01473 [Coprinopsis cinerea okayama7|uniref:Uncharacterized protein n=1 Tax=Coprinopsis cinerea (strain Okayama-7 / 130 / ATCC MYA-4618 / FGSC 9003) TaxID=240176 RepID=A8NYY8_COPC7|nr:hypothetical protein CC1G_01473 [Coprinopsis cinerea okayama7\|eukprot:XP_001837561.1 hypothetical protein CC1G_01473 [Coprinopsis cinerea okayama7\
MTTVPDFCFRSTDLSLTDAIVALESGDELLIPKRYGDKWVLANSKTERGAVFSHIAPFQWASPYDTGNFVPKGAPAPKELDPTRIQNIIGPFCEWSFAMGTKQDKLLFKANQIFEELFALDGEFLKAAEAKSKRTWQDGENVRSNYRFIICSKMFVKRTEKNWPQGGEYKISYDLHPWIKSSLRANEQYTPNPQKPRLFEYVKIGEEEHLKNLSATDRPRFHRGDILWFTFHISASIRFNYWSIDFVPLEIVRIERGQLEDEDPLFDWSPLEVGIMNKGQSSEDDGQVYENQPPDSLGPLSSKRKMPDTPVEEQGAAKHISATKEPVDASDTAQAHVGDPSEAEISPDTAGASDATTTPVTPVTSAAIGKESDGAPRALRTEEGVSRRSDAPPLPTRPSRGSRNVSKRKK